ncbi:MAG: BCAM0308 family protein [Sulfuricella sp.]|nr:BCAM0308 family protein [Sulfuricella sp.]
MKTRFAGFEPIRRDRLIQEFRHDAYQARLKPAEPTSCPICGAVFHEGRWQWAPKPAGAHKELCPACHRIQDELPAGFVTLSGPFLQEHREELLNLVKNEEARAKAEHPLERIIKIEDEDGGILITTTEIHLARDIGEALHHAYKGELEFHYNAQEDLLRVVWER